MNDERDAKGREMEAWFEKTGVVSPIARPNSDNLSSDGVGHLKSSSRAVVQSQDLPRVQLMRPLARGFLTLSPAGR